MLDSEIMYWMSMLPRTTSYPVPVSHPDYLYCPGLLAVMCRACGSIIHAESGSWTKVGGACHLYKHKLLGESLMGPLEAKAWATRYLKGLKLRTPQQIVAKTPKNNEVSLSIPHLTVRSGQRCVYCGLIEAGPHADYGDLIKHTWTHAKDGARLVKGRINDTAAHWTACRYQTFFYTQGLRRDFAVLEKHMHNISLPLAPRLDHKLQCNKPGWLVSTTQLQLENQTPSALIALADNPLMSIDSPDAAAFKDSIMTGLDDVDDIRGGPASEKKQEEAIPAELKLRQGTKQELATKSPQIDAHELEMMRRRQERFGPPKPKPQPKDADTKAPASDESSKGLTSKVEPGPIRPFQSAKGSDTSDTKGHQPRQLSIASNPLAAPTVTAAPPSAPTEPSSQLKLKNNSSAKEAQQAVASAQQDSVHSGAKRSDLHERNLSITEQRRVESLLDRPLNAPRPSYMPSKRSESPDLLDMVRSERRSDDKHSRASSPQLSFAPHKADSRSSSTGPRMQNYNESPRPFQQQQRDDRIPPVDAPTGPAREQSVPGAPRALAKEVSTASTREQNSAMSPKAAAKESSQPKAPQQKQEKNASSPPRMVHSLRPQQDPVPALEPLAMLETGAGEIKLAMSVRGQGFEEVLELDGVRLAQSLRGEEDPGPAPVLAAPEKPRRKLKIRQSSQSEVPTAESFQSKATNPLAGLSRPGSATRPSTASTMPPYSPTSVPSLSNTPVTTRPSPVPRVPAVSVLSRSQSQSSPNINSQELPKAADPLGSKLAQVSPRLFAQITPTIRELVDKRLSEPPSQHVVMPERAPAVPAPIPVEHTVEPVVDAPIIETPGIGSKVKTEVKEETPVFQDVRPVDVDHEELLPQESKKVETPVVEPITTVDVATPPIAPVINESAAAVESLLSVQVTAIPQTFLASQLATPTPASPIIPSDLDTKAPPFSELVQPSELLEYLDLCREAEDNVDLQRYTLEALHALLWQLPDFANTKGRHATGVKIWLKKQRMRAMQQAGAERAQQWKALGERYASCLATTTV